MADKRIPTKKRTASSRVSQRPSATTEKKRRRRLSTENSVVSLESKLPKLKQQRKRKMMRRLIFMISLFLFAILGILYSQSSLSHIDYIEVSGAKEVTDQAVIDASKMRSGDSLWNWYFKKDEMEKDIKKKLIQVKSVDLKFVGLNSFELDIQEYKTVAYLTKDDLYYNVLENGKIVKESRKVPIGNLPVLSNFTEGDALTQLIKSLEEVPTEVLNTISEIEYQNSDKNRYLIYLYMNDGNTAIANIPDFPEKIKYYAQFVSILGDKKGIIDMEVEPFYRPFPEAEAPAEESVEEPVE